MWRRRSEQEIDQTRRCGFPAASSAANHAIVLNDKIDDSVARFLGVTGKLAGEVRALQGNGRHHPPEQADQGDEDAGKNDRDGHAAAHFTTAELGHERIEQVGKNRRDRDRN